MNEAPGQHEVLAAHLDSIADAVRAAAEYLRSSLAAPSEPEAPSDTQQPSRARPVSNDLEDLLTLTQVAELLGVCPRTVRRLELEGEISAPVRLGRVKRWRRRDLEGLTRGQVLTRRLGSR